MPNQGNVRPRGTGSVFVKHGSYYGRWRAGGRELTRKIGPVREPSTRNGLTKTQAETRLREMMTETQSARPVLRERMTVDEAGAQLLLHLATIGRKRNTLTSYEYHIEQVLAVWFGVTPLAEITAADIEKFVAHYHQKMQRSTKSVRNDLAVLSVIFNFAVKKGWVAHNPVSQVEKPNDPNAVEETRFLTMEQLERLLRATTDTYRHEPSTRRAINDARALTEEGLSAAQIAQRLGGWSESMVYYWRSCDPDERDADREAMARVDRALYETAAMTGLRQGELLALRWLDVDWLNRRIRVRRNWTAGQYGSPKSGHGRSVPLADRVAQGLERHYQQAAYQADTDLVFGHPHTGKPMDRSRVLKRYKGALRAAWLDDTYRFHDLRHTFGTQMAAAGVPMRTLQEWMGHADLKTTLRYADYAPSASEVEWVNRGFAAGRMSGFDELTRGPQDGPPTENKSDQLESGQINEDG